MRFYTNIQCEEWLQARQRKKPDETAGVHIAKFNYPSEPYRVFHFALSITTIMSRQPALLWITEWGIWDSSENSHLYYKLRQAYGDDSLLPEAPGHLFLKHESEDLASFLQIAMLNGWGGYVLAEANYVNAFFSHDEYLELYAAEETNLSELKEALTPKK